MEIKNIRKPKKSEKSKLIPILIAYGICTAILTTIIYIGWFNKPVGESLYIPVSFWTMKSNATHNALIELFEAVFGRDYMKSRLEGISFSTVLAGIISLTVPIGIKIEEMTKRKWVMSNIEKGLIVELENGKEYYIIETIVLDEIEYLYLESLEFEKDHDIMFVKYDTEDAKVYPVTDEEIFKKLLLIVYKRNRDNI